MHAVIDKRYDLVRLLLDNGANPNAQDRSGNAPLHFATQGHEQEMAALLLASGANVDILDSNGNSPLSNAVFNSQGHGQLIALLLNNGANRDLKNAYGVSPFDLARSIGNFDVAKFFA
jgi:ankyrin repeat protein